MFFVVLARFIYAKMRTFILMHKIVDPIGVTNLYLIFFPSKCNFLTSLVQGDDLFCDVCLNCCSIFHFMIQGHFF